MFCHFSCQVSIFPKPSIFFSDLKSCAFVWTPAFVPQVLGHDLCRLGYDYAGAHRTMGQWALLWSRYLSTWKDATELMIIRLMKISFWTVSCVFFLGGRWCFCIFLCSGGRKDADVVSLQFSFWKDVFFCIILFCGIRVWYTDVREEGEREQHFCISFWPSF